MPTWDVRVDHEVLGSVGRDVSEVAVAVRKAVTRAGTDLAPAPTPGFEAATAAAEAEAVWIAALQGFAERIDTHGTNLSQAAANYSRADLLVVARMHRLGAGELP